MSKKDIVLAAGSLPPGVVTDFTVTKDDVLAIFVSRKEQELLAEKEAADKQIEAVADDIEKASEALKKAVEKAGEDLIGNVVRKVNELLKEAGLSGKFEARTCLMDEDDKKSLEIGISGCMGGAKKALTPEVRTVLSDIKKLEEKGVEAEKAAIAARQQLMKLPAEERRVRAKLATRALSQSDAGRKFLESFEGNQE
jgi:hypothetical protein